MRIPFLDLQAYYLGIKNEIIAAIQPGVSPQHFILGAEGEAEEKFGLG